MITTFRIFFLVFIFSLILHPKILTCLRDETHYVTYNCDKINNTFTSGSAFQSTLNDTLFSKLPAKALQTNSSIFTNGTGIEQVNALFYCRGDVSPLVCHNCVIAAIDKIAEKCKFMKEAIVWFEVCTLRYSNRSIFFIDEEKPLYLHTNNSGIMNDHFLDPFENKFDSAMPNLVKRAALQGFATTQVNLTNYELLHCVAQCSPDIIGAPCERCLLSALNQRDKWGHTIVFMPSCFFRVDLYRSTIPAPRVDKKPRAIKTIVIALVCAILAIVVAVFCYCYHSALKAIITDVFDKPNFEGIRELRNFTYADLYKATKGFSKRKEIGEGGFAIVYRGVIQGKKVAVKKIKEHIRVSEDEFLSEVQVTFFTNHTNIVKVIGFCNEGDNKLLVYELIENNCLRKHLNGKPKTLNWEARMKIAKGTATGLRYLHEECNPNIIHRDIKPSNILLDSNYEPKVADFGLAKVKPIDVSRVETAVKGTSIYLDPEYEKKKEVTEKSDVYSFGIVLLELITGRSPRLFYNPLQIDATLRLLQGLQEVESDALNDSTSDAYHTAPNGINDCTDPGSDGQNDVSDVMDHASNGLNNFMSNGTIPASGGPTDHEFGGSNYLAPAEVHTDPEILNGLIDPHLKEQYEDVEMAGMIICAAMCVHPSSEGRLTISQVLTLLEERSLPQEGIKNIINYVGSGTEPESSSSNAYPRMLGLGDLKRLATRVLKKPSAA